MTAKEKHGYEVHSTVPGKVWHFLAHEDSAVSFIADAVLVILIGKFIVLPLLGLMLGTPFPMVAVVSSSMEHDGSFNQWWFQQQTLYEGKNISKEQFLQFPHYNGFNKGDVFVVKGVKLADVKIGEVIVYNIPGKSDPIIHRVVGKTNNSLMTKGDANPGQLDFELSVKEEQLKGIAAYRIPYLGWFKVALVELATAIKR